MSDKIKLWIAFLVLITGIGAFYYFSEISNFIRFFIFLITAAISVFIILKTEMGKDIWNFILDAKTEVRKVVWPTRNETIQSTLVVMAMVVVMAILMWLLDASLLWLVRLFTGAES